MKQAKPKNRNRSAHVLFFCFIFGDSNWRQAEAGIVLLAGAVEVNALVQEAVRQFTQWLWIEHPTFQLGGGHLTIELLPPLSYCRSAHETLDDSL